MSSCPFSFCIYSSLPSFLGPLPFSNLYFFLTHFFFSLTFFIFCVLLFCSLFFFFFSPVFFVTSLPFWPPSHFLLPLFFQPSLFTPFPQFSPSTFYNDSSVLFQSPTLFCPSIPLGPHLYIMPPFYLMFCSYSFTLSIDSQTPSQEKISLVSHSALASAQVSASTFCPPVFHTSLASHPFSGLYFLTRFLLLFSLSQEKMC